MIMADPTYPKDKYYQLALARAKAWTGFAGDTTKTATSERNALKKHFLPAALTGAGYGSVGGAAVAIAVGASQGAKVGVAVAGLEGAAVGAGLGALIGGISSLAKRIKDKIIGPPVAYYNLDAGGAAVKVSSQVSSRGLSPIPAPGLQNA
ncbi:MAG: Phist protein (Pf-fam-b) [Microgenomates group bacterium GW2011_GWC1_43_11]|uniref:Phist protein (Pf-fam-b) n=1 Tax=Candidatus Gottesmanbacteria bacterium GW2011_GWB1_44_11c TaxID=1618447 RepID=A0A0G1J0Q3_9BACT|nr:MAG: Phist protein (Pf-fam-b) [Microgenomates group bacterium GW2011_GWC1_43_11]KKT37667.1 MAG: Phist protein (Pf-fam-b) [Candidatus Gottesmanbacteria bacterium GW2011_GWB1_44_11c]HCM82498.1 hypothetical protein [Patescibacteria group bacterium]